MLTEEDDEFRRQIDEAIRERLREIEQAHGEDPKA